MKLTYWIFTFIFSLSSCSQDSVPSHLKRIEIAARDEGDPSSRPLIYCFKIPPTWIQHNSLSHVSNADTTQPLVEFYVHDNNEKIRIAIHNFPSDRMDQRIPPLAQITRWKKQFQSLDPSTIVLKPQAFGGYSGLLLEATGQMKGIKTSILGWSLQLAPEHYQVLSQTTSTLITKRYRQMRGDVTIKVLGPSEMMHRHREEIIAFARSFQLIDDIP